MIAKNIYLSLKFFLKLQKLLKRYCIHATNKARKSASSSASQKKVHTKQTKEKKRWEIKKMMGKGKGLTEKALKDE